MPSRKQRKKKAKLLGLKAARFRELYQEAYGPKAFKPYTHMTMHIEEMQLNCQYDLIDYCGQSQEHYGKIMKNLIKHQCNHHLGKKEDGSNKSSSVMQVAKNMAYRQELMEIVPVPLPDYTLAKLKKELAGEGHFQMVKTGQFEDRKVPLSTLKPQLIDSNMQVCMEKKQILTLRVSIYISHGI